MTKDPKQTTNVAKEPRFSAVVVPEHLHREVQTFVEQLVAQEGDAEAYSMFVGGLLDGAQSGNKAVTTKGEPGTKGDMLDLGYDS